MVRIMRSKPGKASTSSTQRKRKSGESKDNDLSTSVSPKLVDGLSLRASKRARTSHVPYQSPESVDVLLVVSTRRKKAAENEATPKRKVKSRNNAEVKSLEKPVKRLQKQVSTKTKQTAKVTKQSVRRKVLSTPEPSVKPNKSQTRSKPKSTQKLAVKKAIKLLKHRTVVIQKTNTKSVKSTNVDNVISSKQMNTKEKSTKRSLKQPKEKKEKVPKKVTKGKKGKLNPRPELTSYEKDPTYESRLDIPFLSTIAQSRLLIRAVILNDMKLLKKLVMDEPQNIYTTCMWKNAADHEDVFSYIAKTENKEALKLLAKIPDKVIQKFGSSPNLLISAEGTGHGSTMMFGHALKQVCVGRGGKEGNNAFLYDQSVYHIHSTAYDMGSKVITKALEMGSSQSFITSAMELLEMNTWNYTEIHKCLRKGHYQLAGKVIADGNSRGGYGFNLLHQEVLTKTNSSMLTPFKPVSVVKKCTYEPRMTPLHCAATNPNVDVLTTLLRSMPDYSNIDGHGWTVGHYAAVCCGPEPLKYLLQFGISTHAVTSTKRNGDGYTLLHAAVSAGRVHNVKIILEHEKKTANEANVTGDATLDDAAQLKAKKKAFIQNDIMHKQSTKGENSLHMACKLGHADIVKLLVDAGIDTSLPTPAKFDRMTPLMIASQNGHLEIVKILIDAGVKVEVKDRRGRTAAAYAAMYGQAHVMSYLLRLGVNHLALDSSGNSFLHYTAAYGWYFATMLLLEAGCPLNAPNHWKMTPVAIAFMKGHTGLVEILMKRENVDVNARIDDTSGRSLLLEAVHKSSDYAKMKFLIGNLKADPNSEDFDGQNGLHYLAMKKVYPNSHNFDKELKELNECISYLFHEGCDTFKKNTIGKSSILLAASSGNFHFILKLLQLNITIPYEKDDNGYTLLHYLANCIVGSSEIAFSVFTKYVNNSTSTTVLKEMTKSVNNDGYTPLLLLLSGHQQNFGEDAKKNILKTIEVLLGKLGASANAKVEKGTNQSALHLVVSSSYSDEILPILLKHKPDLDPVDNKKQTPLQMAITNGNQSIAEKLIDAGANVNLKMGEELYGISLLMLYAMKETKSFSIIPKFIQKGATANEIHPKTKNSILHYISRRPTVHHAAEALQSVLDAGVNPNLVNCDGRTALHLSVNARGSETDVFYDVEDTLISSGANSALKDVRGRIPLHYAFVKVGKPTDSSFFDPIELVSSLVTAMKAVGAETQIHSTDVFGSTPLHYAAYRGATICSSYLMQAISKHDIDLCDNNGNTPFGLAVRNAHEGCALNFYQKDADYLRIINNKIQVKELQTEEMAGTKRVPLKPEVWKWSCIAEENDEVEKLNEEKEKYPILEQVVKHNWQGLLYLMIGRLQSSGIGFSTGIYTALKTHRQKLALKLAQRVKSKKELMLESGTLFHCLGKYYAGSADKEIAVKIYEALLKNGLDPATTDEFQSQPVIYAVINHQTQLCDILLNTYRTSTSILATMKPDLFGRTPFTALFWNLKLETSLQPTEESWASHLIAAGANPNQLCEFPVSLSPFPGVRFNRKLTNIIPSNGTRYTPLIMAVLTKSFKTVKWLLNLKSGFIHADINDQDSDGRSALMHAVRLNDTKMVKLLLDPQGYDYNKDINGSKNIKVKSSVNVALRDKQGWTVMDYLLLSPGRNCYYKNVKQICQILHNIKASSVTSGASTDAISGAVQYRKQDITDIISLGKKSQLYAGVYPDFSPIYSQDIVHMPIDDFSLAAEKMAEKILEKKREEIRKKGGGDEFQPKPDPLCGLDLNNAELLIDEKQNIPYDCLMTKVDLSYGIHGLYNFYKMQLVKQPRGKELIILFTQWGRVGDRGQYQKTPCANEEDAIKEFSKIFKSKSGNAWEDVQNFNAIPSKYRLVKKDLRVVKHFTQANVDFEEMEKAGRSTSSSLPRSIITLVKTLCLVHQNGGSIYDKGGYYNRNTTNYTDLPLLPIEVLHEAENILQEIYQLIETKEKMSRDGKMKYTEQQNLEILSKIAKLSENFYTLVPVFGYSTEKLEPMFAHHEIRDKLEAVSRIIHMELAKTLLLAAQYNQVATNPFEYVYRSLDTTLQLLDRSDAVDGDEAEVIMQYIHNGGESPKVHGIYRIQKSSEDGKLSSSNVHNRHLLWHGTGSINMLSVLQNGLQVAPLGSQISGHLFGKGIYLADTFAKSQHYCRSVEVNGKNRKFMLLCEAALGKVYEVKLDDACDKPMPNGFNSLKTADSRYEPDPETTIIWKGRTVPLGKRVEKVYKHEESYGLDYNEYIVFEKKQVALRYLIEFED